MDLELKIGTSAGSISRIERGQTNPTKETLHKIAVALELNSDEKAIILELYPLFPSNEEIKRAKEEVKEYFSKDGVVAYIYNDWWMSHAASKDAHKVFGIPKIAARLMLGRNLLEVMFNYKTGLRRVIDPKHFNSLLAMEVARARAEMDFELEDGRVQKLKQKLMKLPDFQEVWKMSASVPKERVLPKQKVAAVIIGGDLLNVRYAREKLKDNPRFEITEFYI